ncbi:glycosyltransferase family 2 protein [Halolamina sp. CBA1230]|uniref:glycosyltransferase family 2 protein n=1 Tax=Halolamina sp. CBA1230 TaxID=1853690 RepID=UPI0009A25567|nr:glycosyltransferase family 2 protein [Halolamina sp. CBA1230]
MSSINNEQGVNGEREEYQLGEPQTAQESREEEGVLLPADSEATPAISLVMPTLNEEEGIRECIRRAKTAFRELGVQAEIIVSDSSTDRTPEIAREEGAIVVEPDGKGYGYAYQYAFEKARADVIAMGDADTTYDFEELPKLYELVANGDADMAMGSRLEGEIKPGAMPTLHQYVGNPLLTKFLNTFYGAGVSDAHSGMRVFTQEAWEAMGCETTGMEFASEMIMQAGAADLQIVEEPIVYHEREGEETLESFRDGWRHVRFMLLNAPGYLFSVPGMVLGLFGMLVMASVAFGVPGTSVTLGANSMIAGSLFTIVGYQVASMGIFATISGDPIRKPGDPVTEYVVERLNLERGATAGLVVGGVGATYAGYLVVQWVQSGFTSVPFTVGSILAFTAIVIGVQTVFSAFFMSAVASSR